MSAAYGDHPSSSRRLGHHSFAAAAAAAALDSTPISDLNPRPRSLHLLVASNGPRDVAYAQTIAVRLSKESTITTRAIVDDLTHRLAQEITVHQNKSVTKETEQQAAELIEWADLLVLAPIDADTLAKMMVGVCDNLLLQVLRGWDASKRVLMVPGMTKQMWEGPVTRRQMGKLHRKWGWVRVLPPVLWGYDNEEKKRVVEWEGFNDLVGIIRNQADLLKVGFNVDVPVGLVVKGDGVVREEKKVRSQLPPELWSMIFEFLGDWELAMSLGVYTTLEMPEGEGGWRREPRDKGDTVGVFMHELEWTLLTADTEEICRKLARAPGQFCDLSALAVHLIFKFSLTGVLDWVEQNSAHLFKCFDGKTIPTKASAYYGRTDILDWWARSPSFLEKQYDCEAVDKASTRGFVHVLEWWRRSGLPLKYTEAAFEGASSKGHIHVLEWWREASLQNSAVTLKPGKSLLGAAQWGQVEVMRWWEESGIPVGHHEAVCKMASRWGQVEVLEAWRGLKGDDKLEFDNQILMEATYHAHIGVLEWWRGYAHGELPGMAGRKGRRVEYKTMDVEEALEDSLGDQTRVRRWWAENGLNLGLGTTEWMKIKAL
ncbi:putative decarboxylase [Triangularia verruculosa]|uniref:Decarboxylase n=1 Tax=Triangularia verruculosa TaxID=2587418 RepID=A0AAN6X9B7_9PEZI|nr:putative decarboxylase [Triangularia verruculosa]